MHKAEMNAQLTTHKSFVWSVGCFYPEVINRAVFRWDKESGLKPGLSFSVE